VDDLITELPLYRRSAFPFKQNYEGRGFLNLSKTGTSVNVGYCIAAASRCEYIHLFGCDLGWTSSKGEYGADQNHYFADYRARITAPQIENIRMDFIHLNFSQQLSSKIKVINYSEKSMIKYFDKYQTPIKGQGPTILNYLKSYIILLFDELIRTLKRGITKLMKLIGIK